MTERDKKPSETASEWCVGEPPARWDVSFGGRLAEMIKNMFWRDRGDRPVPPAAPKVGEDVRRRAA
jgi:hypothetical protein